jgi:hypothetical protein
MGRDGGELVRASFLVALCIVGVAHSAHAQSGERLRFSINVADQVTSRTLNQNFSVPINAEPAPIATSIDLSSAPMFDIGGSYRFLHRLAAGLSVTSLSRDVDGTLDAQVPHPFFFNKLRPINGDLSGLQHKETAVHIYAMYFIPVTSKLDVGVFGGPSHFSVKQDFVTDVDFTATYPFDTATFTGAPTETVKGSATGYNAGVDVSWRLSKVLAVGGLVRFTGASKTLTVASGNDVDVKIGGVQTGAGVRILF